MNNKHNISKKKSIGIIEKNIRQFENLLKNAEFNHTYEDDYDKVYHSALSSIRELFSDKEVESFRRNTKISIGFYWLGAPRDLREELKRYEDHLSKCITQLTVYKERINDFWPSKDFVNKIIDLGKWIIKNIKPIVIGIISTVLGGLIIIFITQTYFIEKSEDYKQLKLDFDYKLEIYDDSLMVTFEIMQADWASRGVFNSGEAVTHSIKYFEDCRRRRDYLIDSFFMAYSSTGGDTADLKYEKKLSINVKNILNSSWKDIGFDIEKYKLDTL